MLLATENKTGGDERVVICTEYSLISGGTDGYH